MNITIDKATTLEALQQAEQQFLKAASLIRTNNGPEEVAKLWDARAVSIAVLIDQIRTHGKGDNTNDGQEQSAA